MNTDFINSLEKTGDDQIVQLLQEWEKRLQQVFQFPELAADGQRERVWRALFRWLDSDRPQTHQSALALLRVLTRDKEDLDRVVTSARVGRLVALAGLQTQDTMEHGADPNPDYRVIEEALKCLCNLTHQSRTARQLAAQSAACLQGLTLRLRAFREPELTHPVQLFTVRLLFLLATLCPEIRLSLVHEYHGLTYLTEVLDLLLTTSLASSSTDDSTTEGIELASEILKTMYSVCVSLASPDEEDEGHLMRLTEVLREYLVLPKATNQLHVYVLQVLTTVPPPCYAALVVPETPGARADAGADTSALDAVLRLLSHQIQQPQSAMSQREQLTPALLLLCHSSKACRTIRRHFRAKILPPRRDVRVRPEQGDALKAQLVRLMTSPVSEVKDLAAHFLFIICKEDVGRFVKYTGYGNAAGLLAARGLMLGGPRPSGYSSDSDSDTEEYTQHKDSMDPVTGRVEPERPSPMEGMSDERKIYEAEKLATLINQSVDRGLIRPCIIGEDGRPQPISHVLELQKTAPPAPDSDDE